MLVWRLISTTIMVSVLAALVAADVWLGDLLDRPAIVLGSLALSSCDQSAATRPRVGEPGEGKGANETSVAARVEVSVMSLDRVHQRIATLRGKYVIVDLWALSCTHCIAELPHIVDLHHQHSDHVHAIALNVDFDGDSQPSAELQQKVKAAIVEHKVQIENILCSDPMEDVLADLGIYSLPAALIFDRNGNELRRFDGLVDYEGEIIPFIDGLVAQTPAK